MIDMHSHILPGVDDGASDMDEAINMLRKGMGEGIERFVLTPHLRDGGDWKRFDAVLRVFGELEEECAKRRLNAGIVLGAEVLLIPDLKQRLLDMPAVTIGALGRHVLVELPHYQNAHYTEDLLFDLRISEITPIIAHPERYGYLKIDTALRWAENGVMFQINTGSLNGRYGLRVKWSARKYLKNNAVHFFGTDAHSMRSHKLSYAKALKAAEKLAGPEAAIRITRTLPAMVLDESKAKAKGAG